MQVFKNHAIARRINKPRHDQIIETVPSTPRLWLLAYYLVSYRVCLSLPWLIFVYSTGIARPKHRKIYIAIGYYQTLVNANTKRHLICYLVGVTLCWLFLSGKWSYFYHLWTASLANWFCACSILQFLNSLLTFGCALDRISISRMLNFQIRSFILTPLLKPQSVGIWPPTGQHPPRHLGQFFRICQLCQHLQPLRRGNCHILADGLHTPHALLVHPFRSWFSLSEIRFFDSAALDGLHHRISSPVANLVVIIVRHRLHSPPLT